MDLAQAMAPKSDQMNGDDLLVGPMTVTVKAVRIVGGEQPVCIDLEEFPRPWKPSKSMLRVMADQAIWGPDETKWAGGRLTLYRNGEVKFGPDKVGGIRISHISGIGKKTSLVLTVSKGRKGRYDVEPLSDAAPSSPPMSETEVKIAALRREWKTADDDRKKDIEAEVAVLQNEPAQDAQGEA